MCTRRDTLKDKHRYLHNQPVAVPNVVLFLITLDDLDRTGSARLETTKLSRETKPTRIWGGYDSAKKSQRMTDNQGGVQFVF